MQPDQNLSASIPSPSHLKKAVEFQHIAPYPPPSPPPDIDSDGDMKRPVRLFLLVTRLSRSSPATSLIVWKYDSTLSMGKTPPTQSLLTTELHGTLGAKWLLPPNFCEHFQSQNSIHFNRGTVSTAGTEVADVIENLTLNDLPSFRSEGSQTMNYHLFHPITNHSCCKQAAKKKKRKKGRASDWEEHVCQWRWVLTPTAVECWHQWRVKYSFRYTSLCSGMLTCTVLSNLSTQLHFLFFCD